MKNIVKNGGLLSCAGGYDESHSADANGGLHWSFNDARAVFLLAELPSGGASTISAEPSDSWIAWKRVAPGTFSITKMRILKTELVDPISCHVADSV
mmetsp:Transcript_27156/g.76607  ORF Transcript_27156/g.76607 Transcript_27156/m.76607 type:complete len:97 (-) Transcript_27156:1470-1760(-)|eukprot:CAMPEP_0117696480 /NCGR_PEP_ID=MMETSP0804-20121206/28699_1 /TAXON_ID=1074897 /ORGANISM="Tetraselmis astigmatica, Strain CCMP880" /LENGTH=96 /DNA_ID=CAMNT_0005510629 /DNA_START=346 /DNA_END=636 /DNA_ORIENTATION=+